jgi:DNA-binding transcriptional MerR regulator
MRPALSHGENFLLHVRVCLDLGVQSKVYVRAMTTVTIAQGRRLRVGELAEVVGVAPDTIRYYERAGLLPAPARTAAGYRAYHVDAVDRLRFIQGAQRLGLRLRDIADLLAVRDTGVCPCEPAEQLLRRRLAELDAEMARLSALRAEMVAMVEALPSAECPQPAPGSWCPPVREGGDQECVR